MNRRPVFPVGVASLALCGCAQLAGIDTASDKDRAGDTLTLQRVSIGAAVTTAPLDLTGLTASFRDPHTGATVAATASAPGTWSANLVDPAPVEFTVPDVATADQPAFPRVASLATPAIAAAFTELNHPAPTPAPAPANLAFSVALDAPTTINDSFDLFVVGTWAERPFLTNDLPAIGGTAIGPVTIDYATALNHSSQAQLVAITADDALLILRHANFVLTGVTEAQPFAQTAADTVTTPAMTAVAADQMLTATVDPTSLAARFSTVRPIVNTPAMTWSVAAAPGAADGSVDGPVLRSGNLATTDTSLTASFGNPFLAKHAWPSVFTFSASGTRPFTPPGSTVAATLSATLFQHAVPATGLTLDAAAGLANNIKLNGNVLNVDGVAIAPPTAAVQVAFDTDTANADVYTLTLIDLVANAAKTAIVRRQLIFEISDKPAFSLPAALFQAGHFYTLQISTTVGGFPDHAAGDLQTRTITYAQASVDSAVFTVTP